MNGDARRMPLLDVAREAARTARALGADEVSVVASRSSDVSLTRRAGKLEQAQQATSQGLSFSLLVDDRFSVHGTSDLRPDAVRAFLERAVAATRVLEPEPERRQADPALCGRGVTEGALDATDPCWVGLPVQARREAAQALEDAVDALPERGRVLSATVYLGDSYGQVARVMSNGFEDVHGATGFGAGVEMTLSEPSGRRPEATAWYSALWRADVPGPAAVAKEAWDRAAQRLGSGPAPSGRYAMLLENHAAGRILGLLGGPLSGSEIHQERSCLADKVGQPIGSAAFTLLDDPTVRRGLGSRPYDGDGLVARPMPVVEGGVLRNHYVNVYYGRKLGRPPTTGARSNWIVPPGPRSVPAILADLPRAIVVTGFLGGNSNGLTGDFSFGVQGLLVEHGEVKAHLSEMNVSGNILDVFHRFVEAGDDVWTFGATRSPSLLFADVQFSGA
jgi:PmbA protein